MKLTKEFSYANIKNELKTHGKFGIDNDNVCIYYDLKYNEWVVAWDEVHEERTVTNTAKDLDGSIKSFRLLVKNYSNGNVQKIHDWAF